MENKINLAELYVTPSQKALKIADFLKDCCPEESPSKQYDCKLLIADKDGQIIADIDLNNSDDITMLSVVKERGDN